MISRDDGTSTSTTRSAYGAFEQEVTEKEDIGAPKEAEDSEVQGMCGLQDQKWKTKNKKKLPKWAR